MSLARRVALNTVMQFGGKVVTTFLGLVTVALLQRSLQPEGFGAYTIVMSFLGFFSVVADFGLYLILSRELNKPGADRERVFANVLGIRLATFGAVFVAALAVLPFFGYGGSVNEGIVIGVAGFLAVAVTQLTTSLFQASLTMNNVVIGEFLGRVGLLVGTVLALQGGFGLSGIIGAVVVGNILNLIFILTRARRQLRIRVAYDRAYWGFVLRETAPVALSVVLNLIYFRMDTIILSLYRPAAEVGLYGAAYKILEVLNTFPIMFVGLMLPILTQAFATDPERFRRIYQRAFDVLAMGVLPLIVGGWFLAQPLLVFIGDENFGAAAPVFRLLLIAVGFLYLNSLSGHTVTIINKQRTMVWGYLTVAVAGLVLYLVLIPRTGMWGAAIGTILTEATIAIIGGVMVMRTVRFRLSFRTALKALLASGVMGVTLWLIPGQHLLVELVAGTFAYGAVLVLTKSLPVEFLRDLLRREPATLTEPPA